MRNMKNDPNYTVNTIKLSLPPWGRCPPSKLGAKRDGEGIAYSICPLTRLRRELSQRESLFSLFFT